MALLTQVRFGEAAHGFQVVRGPVQSAAHRAQADVCGATDLPILYQTAKTIRIALAIVDAGFYSEFADRSPRLFQMPLELIEVRSCLFGVGIVGDPSIA